LFSVIFHVAIKEMWEYALVVRS